MGNFYIAAYLFNSHKRSELELKCTIMYIKFNRFYIFSQDLKGVTIQRHVSNSYK